MYYSLYIPEGTKVLGMSGLVCLSADVFVDMATRDDDGAYRYQVGGKEYICSAGCCKASKSPQAVRHADGLVWIA